MTGAHVAAVTAKSVSKGLVSRVTGVIQYFIKSRYKYIVVKIQCIVKIGLDPAHNIPNHVDPSIAQFVDIMHTNGGNNSLSEFYLAIYEPMGHADFYVNGGQEQPGCPSPSEGCDIGKLSS